MTDHITSSPRVRGRLTAKQRGRVADIVERWGSVHDSTEPADHRRAEAGIREAYASAGFRPPKRIEWVASPLAAIEPTSRFPGRNVGHSAGYLPTLDATLRREVYEEPLRETIKKISARLDPPALDEIESAVVERFGEIDPIPGLVFPRFGSGFSPGDARRVHKKLEQTVSTEERQREAARIIKRKGLENPGGYASAMHRAAILSTARMVIAPPVFGQHAAAILAYADALISIGAPNTFPLNGIFEVARHACWWWPYEDKAVVSERAVARNVNRKGRARLEFADGFGVPGDPSERAETVGALV